MHDLEAVFVIAVQNTGSHEREDRHDISEDRLWGQVGETRDEKEGLVESLWIIRHFGWREDCLADFAEGVTHGV